jgi:tripartite-type tricarboxylate transporter receptor subunit TctC
MPAGAPAPMMSSLNAAVRAALAPPEIKARFEEHGGTCAASSPEECAAFIHKERLKWGDLIRRAAVRPKA